MEGASLGAQPWVPAAMGRVCGCVPARQVALWLHVAWPTFSLFFRAPLPPRLLACAQAGVPVPWGVPGMVVLRGVQRGLTSTFISIKEFCVFKTYFLLHAALCKIIFLHEDFESGPIYTYERV